MKESTLNITNRPRRVAPKRTVKKVEGTNEKENTNYKAKIHRNGKRSVSEMSPSKAPLTRKRPACGDITNAIQAHSERLIQARKKNYVTQKNQKEVLVPAKRVTRVASKKAITNVSNKVPPVKKQKRAIEIPEFTCELISSSNENQEVQLVNISSSSNIDRLLNDSIMSNDGKKSVSNTSSSSLNTSIRPVPNLPAAMIEEYETPSKVLSAPSKKIKPYDIDTDPYVVSEYAESVFRNMKKREGSYVVRDYLNNPSSQTTGSMRAILVDWLVEVQENFELYHETLYLAIKIVDNYLQNKPTAKELLQLVGATALQIACKIEEHHPPPLDDFKFICDDAYTHKQFIQMEIKILKTLDFDINLPIPYRFLRRYARVNAMSMQILTLSRYILELSLQEATFVVIRPSLIAAACLCLAQKMKDEGEWEENLIFHTTYKESELHDIMIELNKMVEIAPKSKLQTVRTKYMHPIFFEVAKTPAVDALYL